MGYEKFKKRDIIFSQGEDGDRFYIILSGVLAVIVTHMGIRFTACELFEGEQFGELALANNVKRAATIVALQDCEVLTVDKDDYINILRSVHVRETREKVLLFRQIPQMQVFSKDELFKISTGCVLQRYAQHTVM